MTSVGLMQHVWQYINYTLPIKEIDYMFNEKKFKDEISGLIKSRGLTYIKQFKQLLEIDLQRLKDYQQAKTHEINKLRNRIKEKLGQQALDLIDKSTIDDVERLEKSFRVPYDLQLDEIISAPTEQYVVKKNLLLLLEKIKYLENFIQTNKVHFDKYVAIKYGGQKSSKKRSKKSSKKGSKKSSKKGSKKTQ
jgi:hypothetical protein